MLLLGRTNPEQPNPRSQPPAPHPPNTSALESPAKPAPADDSDASGHVEPSSPVDASAEAATSNYAAISNHDSHAAALSASADAANYAAAYSESSLHDTASPSPADFAPQPNLAAAEPQDAALPMQLFPSGVLALTAASPAGTLALGESLIGMSAEQQSLARFKALLATVTALYAEQPQVQLEAQHQDSGETANAPMTAAAAAGGSPSRGDPQPGGAPSEMRAVKSELERLRGDLEGFRTLTGAGLRSEEPPQGQGQEQVLPQGQGLRSEVVVWRG